MREGRREYYKKTSASSAVKNILWETRLIHDPKVIFVGMAIKTKGRGGEKT